MVRAPLIHAQEATWSCRRGLADHANIYRKNKGPKQNQGPARLWHQSNGAIRGCGAALATSAVKVIP